VAVFEFLLTGIDRGEISLAAVDLALEA